MLGKREKIRIDIKIRGKRIFISSKDIPGLWLWGKDPQLVFNNIAPAIAILYKRNRGIDVEIKESLFFKINRWRFLRSLNTATEVDKHKGYLFVSDKRLTPAHG